MVEQISKWIIIFHTHQLKIGPLKYKKHNCTIQCSNIHWLNQISDFFDTAAKKLIKLENAIKP